MTQAAIAESRPAAKPRRSRGPISGYGLALGFSTLVWWGVWAVVWTVAG